MSGSKSKGKSKQVSKNEKLRQDRLTFYKDDIDRIEKLLAEFLRLSGAKCALLIDKEGHLVTKTGELRTIDIDTISALVAGSFAATKEMARLLGEEEFTAMFHQGERDNIQLSDLLWDHPALNGAPGAGASLLRFCRWTGLALFWSS